MEAILEINPSITDTQEERDALFEEMKKMDAEQRQADDFFVEVPDDEPKEIEESASIFKVDGKNMEFEYISSINRNGTLYSFAQDYYGLWWWFVRTGPSEGKGRKGPFTTKDKLLRSMGELYA